MLDWDDAADGLREIVEADVNEAVADKLEGIEVMGNELLDSEVFVDVFDVDDKVGTRDEVAAVESATIVVDSEIVDISEVKTTDVVTWKGLCNVENGEIGEDIGIRLKVDVLGVTEGMALVTNNVELYKMTSVRVLTVFVI